ncbi:hypothetical protein F383_36706 [Gossypium arboreum]|uniref:Uncharacterized protein n=1 Tax=Gossypium arboreum TaxID=29729 RepID=A0A0B0M988_GOSAR|nr:hypothetical protein F383_36706 [Gossypium arboreum]
MEIEGRSSFLMVNPASEMDQSASLEQFPASFSPRTHPCDTPCKSCFDSTKLTRPCGLPV